MGIFSEYLISFHTTTTLRGGHTISKKIIFIVKILYQTSKEAGNQSVPDMILIIYLGYSSRRSLLSSYTYTQLT